MKHPDDLVTIAAELDQAGDDAARLRHRVRSVLRRLAAAYSANAGARLDAEIRNADTARERVRFTHCIDAAGNVYVNTGLAAGRAWDLWELDGRDYAPELAELADNRDADDLAGPGPCPRCPHPSPAELAAELADNRPAAERAADIAEEFATGLEALEYLARTGAEFIDQAGDDYVAQMVDYDAPPAELLAQLGATDEDGTPV